MEDLHGFSLKKIQQHRLKMTKNTEEVRYFLSSCDFSGWAAYHLRSRLGAFGDCGRTNMSDTCCTWHVWWSMLYIYIYSQTNSRTLAYKPNVAIIDFQTYIICFVDVFVIFHVSWQFAGDFPTKPWSTLSPKKNRPATLTPGRNEDEPLLRENWGFSQQQ